MKLTSAAPVDAAIGCNETSTCGDVTGTEVWRTLLAVYLGAILVVSVAMNGTLCLVFYKKQHLLNISNCFVLNLACCHLVMALLVIPCTFYAAVSHGTVYSGAWCHVQGFVFTSCVVTVQLALLVISLDRNYAIMNSLRYPNVFTQKLCTVMIVFSWGIGLILSFPPLLNSGLGTYTFHRYQFMCTLDWTGTSPYLHVFHIFAFVLPILVQGFCYLKIFKAALGHTKRSMRVYPWVTNSSVKTVKDCASDSSESTESLGSEDIHRGATQYKAVRTIFLIALSYCICWVPYLAESYLVHTRKTFYPHLSAASICLVFSTGLLNPVIYAYMNRITRREIGRFICGIPVVNDSEDFVSTSMSTYPSAKQTTGIQRMRSRSAGGLNEMDTILEEAEESQICETRSVCNMALGEACRAKHFTQTSPPGAKQRGEILNVFQLSDNAVSHKTNLSKTVIKTEPIQSSSTGSSKISRTAKHKPRHRQDSAWTVVQDKLIDEKRRYCKNGLDGYHYKERRRKLRDYGSFLSFEEREAAFKGKKHSGPENKKLKKCKSQRLSVDHVQRVSINSIPNIMKFRFSVSDIDEHLQTVTVRSNLEIGNRSSGTTMVDIDQESSSCDPYIPVFDEILPSEAHIQDKTNGGTMSGTQETQIPAQSTIETHAPMLGAQETQGTMPCTQQSPVGVSFDACQSGQSVPVSPGHVCADWVSNKSNGDESSVDTAILDGGDTFLGPRLITTRRSV